MELRRCCQCKEEKPLSEFRLGAQLKNGKRYPASNCNECHRVEAREYRQRNLEASREREREYGRKNAERKRENASRWYYANKERALAQRAAAYAQDPELVRDRAHMSRARRVGAPEIEFVRRLEVYERDGGICHECGGHVPLDEFEADHVLPLSKGGSHTYANVRTSHRRCNLARRYI